MNRPILFALVIGSLVAGLTFDMEMMSRGFMVFLLIPGVIASMGISNNVHAFPLWIAAVFNFFFYFLLNWCLIWLASKIFKRKT